MLIIDAQVHIWGSGKPSAHHRQTSVFTAEELIKEMDAAGVDGAGTASAELGPWLERNGDPGCQAISQQILQPRLVSSRRSVSAQADRDLETAARHAGITLVPYASGTGDLA